MMFIKVAPKDKKLKLERHLLNILSSFNYILLIARVAGLLYFTIRRHQLETNMIRSLLYSIIYLTIYLGLFLMNFQNVKYIKDGSFYNLVKYVAHVSNFGYTLFQVVYGYFLRFRMAKWLNHLAAFDVDMERFGVIFNFKPMQKHLINLVIMEIILVLLKIALNEAVFCNSWLAFLISNIFRTIKSIYKVTFLAVIGHVHLRFKKINDAMSEFNSGGMNGSWESIFPVIRDIRQDFPWKLDQLCKFHFRLCHLTRNLNSIASFYFFSSFAMSLGVMMFIGYFMYHDFRLAGEVACRRYENYLSEFDSMSRQKIIALAYFLITLAHEFATCLVIMRACESLCYEANCTPKILHELRIRMKDRTWDDCIVTNSLQFMHQKVIISAYGFFNINQSVFASMIELTITYIVLFIRHDQATLGPTSDFNEA